MVIFRVVEKTGLHEMFGNGWIQYITTMIIVLCGATVFSVALKKGIVFVGELASRHMAKR